MKQPSEAGSSFAPAFLLLDSRQRAALSAYYGFAREADDIADSPGLPAEKYARLDRLRAEAEALFTGPPRDAAPATGLTRAIRHFGLKPEHFLLVLQGVRMDVEPRTYETASDLESYMRLVAGAVGLACLKVFRYSGPSGPALAEKLGFAMQLTNIIRDSADDHAAGRVYLPLEDLRRFGCSPADLGGSNYLPNFIELMKFEAARAREYYSAARALAEPAHKRQLAPALAMAGLYEGLLNKIEAGGFRVKEERVRLSAPEKAAALFRAGLDYLKI